MESSITDIGDFLKTEEKTVKDKNYIAIKPNFDFSYWDAKSLDDFIPSFNWDIKFLNYTSKGHDDIVSWISHENDFSKIDDFSRIGRDSSSQEKLLTQKAFESQGFITQENWESETLIQALIIESNEENITCECLVDKAERIFELRDFNPTFFSNLDDTSPGTPVLIKTRFKPGSIRIDILEGENLVDKSFFEIEHLYDEIEGKGLDNPFFSQE